MDKHLTDIFKAIRPLKNRIHLNTAIMCLVWGFAAAGGLALVIACLALVYPVPFLPRILMYTYLAAIVLALLAALFMGPGNLKVLATADSLGLKERLVTAYQLQDDSSPIARIQRFDTLKAVSHVNFKELYPVTLPKKPGLAALALILLVAVSFLIPSSAKENAANMEALLKEIKNQAARLDNERKELAKSSGLTDKKLQEINKRIDELLKELKKSSSEGEAVKALSKAKHELEELKSSSTKTDLSKLRDSLSNNPVTRPLGEAIKKGDFTDIKQRLESMNNSFKNLDEAGKKKLAEEIKKAAAEVAKNKELAQSLRDVSDALSAGSLSDISGEMKELTDALSKLAAEDQQIAQAMEEFENSMLEQLSDSIDSARKKISGASGSKGKYSKGGASGKAGQQENEDNEQNSSPAGSAEGSKGSGQTGSQPGGSQTGKPGNGVGDGTGNKDAGYSEEQSASSGRKPGEKKVMDYESVYVPSRIGGDNTESNLTGRKNASGQSQWTDGSAPVQKGSTVPYDKVLSEYKSEAMSSMQDSSIPPVMQDIVRDYFSSLE